MPNIMLNHSGKIGLAIIILAGAIVGLLPGEAVELIQIALDMFAGSEVAQTTPEPAQ